MNENEMLEQFKLVIDSVGQMIQDSEKRMIQRMEEKIAESEHNMIQRVEEKIAESEHNMKLYMELNVEKRIDALFDGYKLTHEKQWELEHETQRMKEHISSSETRLSALEKNLSA